MKRAPLGKVRFISIGELAGFWYKQLKLPQEMVLRELQLGVINLDRVSNGLDWIKEFPKESKLPLATHRVDRLWVSHFCNKQEWPYPLFWFPSEDPNPRRRGRPAYPHMEAIRGELARRAERLELSTTLTEEARQVTSPDVV